MVVGLTLENGLSALLNAVEEPRLRPEPAQTLSLLTEDFIAWDQKERLENATHMNVPLIVNWIEWKNKKMDSTKELMNFTVEMQ